MPVDWSRRRHRVVARGGVTGWRGHRACQIFLASLSGVLELLPEIADILLNPLIVHADGVCIVDAWVRVAPYRWDPSPAVRRLA